jgi:hypothetical protein
VTCVLPDDHPYQAMLFKHKLCPLLLPAHHLMYTQLVLVSRYNL